MIQTGATDQETCLSCLAAYAFQA